MTTLGWVAAGIAALALAGCHSEEARHSAEEVKTAFRDAGVSLTERLQGVPPVGGVLLSGNVGGEFFVAIYSDEKDAKAADDLVKSQTSPILVRPPRPQRAHLGRGLDGTRSHASP